MTFILGGPTSFAPLIAPISRRPVAPVRLRPCILSGDISYTANSVSREPQAQLVRRICGSCAVRTAARQWRRRKAALPAELHNVFSWKRKRQVQSCFAQAGAAALGSDVQQESNSSNSRHQRLRLPNICAAWGKWWHLEASDKVASDSKPQSLMSIVTKLWRLMRVNKLLLAGAFIFMVSHALNCWSHNVF